MLDRFFLRLSYNGQNYHGWQKQVDVPSVQGQIEDCLQRLFGRSIHCHGCGRTDKGVHASDFYAHIDLEPKEHLKLKRLDKILPREIRLKRIYKQDRSQDAQMHASARTYLYQMHFDKAPFIEETSALYDKTSYDHDKIEKAFLMLREVKDFKSFCKTPSAYKNTLCNIMDLKISRSTDRITLQLTANRFLRSMIRYLVASILDVGASRISLEDWQRILQNELELPFRKEAYAHGLFLKEVLYPFPLNEWDS